MLNLILLQNEGAAVGSGLSSIIMILLIVVIFYFFMIRPQSNKQKELRKFREGLKKGDKVTTAGGIHGRVREIKDKTMVIEIADNVKITIDSTMVYQNSQDAAEDVNAKK